MEEKKKSTKKKNTNTKKTNTRKKSTIKKTSTKKTSVKKTINKQVIKEDNKKNNIKFIKSFLITLLILVLIYGISLLLNFFVIPTVRIYDNSMLPGLNDKNIIMLYKTNKVKKGDVVAVYVEDKMLIKRCVATSNDVVNIDTDGNLYVNDKLVKENYLKNKSIGKFSIDLPYTVPEHHIFILSDDRETYSDSRNILIGSIDEDNIYGKALIKLYPIKDIGIVR